MKFSLGCATCLGALSLIAGAKASLDVIGGIKGAELVVVTVDEARVPVHQADGSVLKISVGMDRKGMLSAAGGDFPDVKLWDAAGALLNYTEGVGIIGHGETSELFIGQTEKREAAYTMLRAQMDAICVASAMLTTVEGMSYGWVGDWAPICRLPWAYSNIQLAGKDYSPKCMWLDKDRSDSKFPTALGLHWAEFKVEEGAEEDVESILESRSHQSKYKTYICKNGISMQPKFEAFPTTMTIWGSKPTSYLDWYKKWRADQQKQRNGGRSVKLFADAGESDVDHQNIAPGNSHSDYEFSGVLIKTDEPSHSMEELCNDIVSAGPDYVNTLEGKFCRMSDKKLFPVCGGDVEVGCFDLQTDQLLDENKLVDRAHVPYHNVMDWAAENKASKVEV